MRELARSSNYRKYGSTKVSGGGRESNPPATLSAAHRF
jgi:hypothetical protein